MKISKSDYPVRKYNDYIIVKGCMLITQEIKHGWILPSRRYMDGQLVT